MAGKPDAPPTQPEHPDANGSAESAARDYLTGNVITGGVFFHAVIQGQNITVQLPPQVPKALSGLPVESATFTGRDADLERLLELLDPQGPEAGLVQVLAIAGLGGVGKTELALQAAHAARWRGWFPGGVLFVDVFGYDEKRRLEPAHVLDGWLRALGLSAEHIPPDPQDRVRLYSSVLTAFSDQNKGILVVIDNASSAAQVRTLLPPRGAARALVTSRDTLGDLSARLLDLDVLTREASAELLDRELHLSRGAQDTRVRDHPADTRAVAELCGGLPLAVEIVAALLAANPTRSLHAMAVDLADARTRLDEIRYEDKAVRAAFDLSYRRLDDEHARLFRLLTLNSGREVSTEAVAALTGQEQRPTRRMMEALARAHLIEPGSAEGRWRLHDLVRIYAEEQGRACAESDHRQIALERLLHYYLTVADAADICLRAQLGTLVPGRFTSRQDALAWLDGEHENLVSAVSIATSTGHPDTAVLMAAAIAEFLDWRRRFDDWITVSRIAIASARQLADPHGEGRAWTNLGIAQWKTRRFEDAMKAYQRALALCQETGDLHGRGRALTNLGIALWELRRFGESIEAHQQAVHAFRQTGDQDREGRALTNLGLALQDVGRFEEAIEAQHQALTTFHQVGKLEGAGSASVNLGIVLREVGRFEEAMEADEHAVTVFRETGNRHGEGSALNNLGTDLRNLGRFEESIAAHEQALLIFREIGERGERKALNNLGLVLQAVGQPEKAIELHRQALLISREIGDRHTEGTALNNLGLALQDLGQFDEAIEAHQQDMAICRELADRDRERQALNNLETAKRRRQLTPARSPRRWSPWRRRF
jgi:tetratricopeptide (TPR) repeat protein